MYALRLPDTSETLAKMAVHPMYASVYAKAIQFTLDND